MNSSSGGLNRSRSFSLHPFFCRVDAACEEFWLTNRRHIYTTPKSFLDTIQLYIDVLKRQRHIIGEQFATLEGGQVRLKETHAMIDKLQGLRLILCFLLPDLIPIHPSLQSNLWFSSRSLKRLLGRQPS